MSRSCPAPATCWSYRTARRGFHVYDANGGYKRTIPLTGFGDPEGICHVRDDTYAIVEESHSGSNVLSLATITNGTAAIDKGDTESYEVGGVPIVNNKGLEGVAYDAARDVFYSVKESNPVAIYRIALTNGGAHATELFPPPAGCNDLAGVCYDPVAEHLYLLSHEPSLSTSPIIRQTTLDGTVLSTRAVADPEPSYQPEGITMSSDRSTVYVVCESDELIRYAFLPQAVDGWYATGTTIRLQATPDQHYVFQEWQNVPGGTSTANPLDFALSAAYTDVTAVFGPTNYAVTVNSDYGTPQPGSTNVTAFGYSTQAIDSVTIDTAPGVRVRLSGYEIQGAEVSTDAP